MNWQDKGFLISKNKYNENSIIAEFFTEKHGKVSGVIFGATSKKIKNYLLVGNNFHINFSSKNINKLGYFKLEINNLNTPLFLDDKKKLSCVVYTMNLIKLLTVENQENINIFFSIKLFFKNLYGNDWLKHFLLWELDFFKNIGYDINFKDYVSLKKVNGDQKYVVKSNNGEKIIPSFLVEKKNEPTNENELLLGIKIVGDYLDKTILKPNNISFPISRSDFLNNIK
jgi:DNA repair protein RecO